MNILATVRGCISHVGTHAVGARTDALAIDNKYTSPFSDLSRKTGQTTEF